MGRRLPATRSHVPAALAKAPPVGAGSLVACRDLPPTWAVVVDVVYVGVGRVDRVVRRDSHAGSIASKGATERGVSRR